MFLDWSANGKIDKDVHLVCKGIARFGGELRQVLCIWSPIVMNGGVIRIFEAGRNSSRKPAFDQSNITKMIISLLIASVSKPNEWASTNDVPSAGIITVLLSPLLNVTYQ